MGSREFTPFGKDASMSVGDSREKRYLATKRIIIAMFMAMIIDGINFQLLSLALPSIMIELKLSNLVGGALGHKRKKTICQ